MSEKIKPAGIDWTGIFATLLKNWCLILIVTAVFGAAGVIAALSQPRKYNVIVTLAPEMQTNTSSSLNSISSLLGVNRASVATSTDALNITLFPEICKSTPFLTGLFPVKLTPYDSRQEVTVFDHMTGADKELKGLRAWLNSLFHHEEKDEDNATLNPSQLTSLQARAVNALSNSISATVDNSGITTISVVLDDPLMATQLADTVCRRLQEYVILYRTQKSIEDYNYYARMTEDAQEKLIKAQAAYAASVDHQRDLILQSVTSRQERLRQEAELASQLYSQMAQQQEMARAKIQEVKPVFAVIQPATMPQKPANSRREVVLTWCLIGFVLACCWVAFGKESLSKISKGVKERLDEPQGTE